MKILTGAYQPDAGEIRVDGTAVAVPTPHAARNLGIGILHQERFPMNRLTSVQNAFIGRAPHCGHGLFVDADRMNRDAAKIFRRGKADIDPAAEVGGMTVPNQQLGGIAKALSCNARVGEPASARNETEVEHLFAIIDNLKARSAGVVCLMHTRDEVRRIAGLTGAGRTDVARTIFRADPVDRGAIHVHGRRCQIGTPRNAVRIGIARPGEDRKHFGSVTPLSVRDNVTMASRPRFASAGRFTKDRDLKADLEDASGSCGSRRRPSIRKPGTLPAATGRRSPSPNGFCATATSSSSMRRRAASTSARRPRSTAGSKGWRNRARRSP